VSSWPRRRALQGLDVPEEWPAARVLVGRPRHDHPRTDARSGDAMDLIVDKLRAAEELGVDRAIGALEDVAALDDGVAPTDVARRRPSVDTRPVEPVNEAKLTDGRDGGGMRCHVDDRVTLLGDKVSESNS
jgi:hypothetical protein